MKALESNKVAYDVIYSTCIIFFHIFEHKSITDIDSIFQTGCRSVRDRLKPDTHCDVFFCPLRQMYNVTPVRFCVKASDISRLFCQTMTDLSQDVGDY